MTYVPREPIERAGDLPLPEVGDLGSFMSEPEHGDAEAREPELERLDLTADEPEGADPLGESETP